MINLQSISFGYSHKKLLFNQLYLNASMGSIHGLLGKNGAGKTTLLKIIAGLRAVNQGNCQVLGYEPIQRNPAFLEQIFFVPEELYLPSVSIKNYIKLNAKFYPLFDHGQLSHYLESFDIDADAHISNMSYGQKKKLLLSFAMATGARLVLFDEPTNGLDIPSKSVFRKLAASAINDNRCFIISTHQVRDLNMLIDSVMLVNRGKLLLNASIDDIASRYAFVTLPRNHGMNNIVYSEEHLEGIKAIMTNNNNIDSEVDLEMLFNATVFGKIFNS